MPESIAEGQDSDLVLAVIVIGQFHSSVEDGLHASGTVQLRSRIGTVTLKAKRIALGPQQMIDVASVGRVAGCATLRESRLMVDSLVGEVADIAVTAYANTYRISLWQAWLVAGVRAMAICAISHGAGMLDFRRFDQLWLVVVAGHAQTLGVGLG